MLGTRSCSLLSLLLILVPLSLSSDAPRVSGAATLGVDSAGDRVLLQLQVVVHAGHVHLERRNYSKTLNRYDQNLSVLP